MEMSRRDVLRLSVAGGSATALGGLIASGVNLMPVVAQAQELRIKAATVTPSVCPFCSVGCATLVHTIDGQIVNIEGDSRSPHNEGTLCPKGAATFQLCRLLSIDSSTRGSNELSVSGSIIRCALERS